MLYAASAKRDDRYPRSSVHFTANGEVQSHIWGNWSSNNKLIVTNFEDAHGANGNPRTMSVVDTWYTLKPQEGMTLPNARVIEPVDSAGGAIISGVYELGYRNSSKTGDGFIGELNLHHPDLTTESIEKIHQVTGEPYPYYVKENINSQGYFKEEVDRIVAETKEKFNQEIRPASQLLFYNSPYINEFLQAGKLVTRRCQDSRGKARHITANWSNHSRLTHFSETLITHQYKEVIGGNLGNHDEHDEDKNKLAIGGTLAVPIAKVIEETPYARGAKYGSATAKEGLSVEHKITKPVSFYEGHFDGAYDSGGMDRVFLKSIGNSQDAQDYEYSTFNMRTEHGTAAFVLIDNQDAERFNVGNDTHEGRKRLGHTNGPTVPDYLFNVFWGRGRGYASTKAL